MEIDAFAIGRVLSISALLGVAGATLAYLLELKLGHAWPIYFGFLLQLVLGVLMYSGKDTTLYFSDVTLLNFGIVFVNPYMISLHAEVDQSGRSAALEPAFINIGSAVGAIFASVANCGEWLLRNKPCDSRRICDWINCSSSSSAQEAEYSMSNIFLSPASCVCGETKNRSWSVIRSVIDRGAALRRESKFLLPVIQGPPGTEEMPCSCAPGFG